MRRGTEKIHELMFECCICSVILLHLCSVVILDIRIFEYPARLLFPDPREDREISGTQECYMVVFGGPLALARGQTPLGVCLRHDLFICVT